MKVFQQTLKLLLLSTTFLFAQNSKNIKGKITSEKGEALVGATILMQKTDAKTFLKANISAADGSFEFEQIKVDSCILTVTMVGYKKYISEKIALQTQSEIPTIILQEDENTLKEVKVTAQKQFVEQKIDRVVINPDVLISNAGTTSLEVLEKAPGVIVDINGNISLKGKPGVMIFIDGKPSYLSSADLANYLRTIPSSGIESIEIMTNPPAKYDAAGNAGVINIKLKKNIAKGTNGSVNLGYGQGRHMRTNNSLVLNHRYQKINFFSNLSLSQNNSYQDLTITRNYFSPTGEKLTTFVQNNLIEPRNSGQNLKMGLDFYPNKNTTMGIVLSGFNTNVFRGNTNNAEITNAQNTLQGLVKATNPAETVFRNGSLNLNLTQKTNKTGGELTFNFDQIVYDVETQQTLTNDNQNAAGVSINKTVLSSVLPSDIQIQAGKIDFLQPLKTGGRFETGFKTSFVNTSNIANFFDVVNASQNPNYEFSNNFQYDENINAAYLNFSKDFKKTSIQAGLRYENTNIVGNQLGNVVVKDSSFTRKFNNLFPTFYVQYRPDSLQRNVFGLNVGRRIDRPNYKDMNPFTYPMDRFTYYGGNPFLQPSFSYNAQLTHTFKGFWTTALEFSFANNIINETNEQRGNIYFSRPGNFAQQISYGVSINGTVKPKKWWTFNVYSSLLNNDFESTLYGQKLDDSRWFVVLMPTNQFVINKKWSAELAGSYQSKVLSGQFLVIPIWSVRGGVSTKILKDKGSLKLNVNDIFYTNQVGGNIRNIANATASWFSYLDTRVATITFSYRFNKGQNLKVRQSGGSDSEQKRVKS